MTDTKSSSSRKTGRSPSNILFIVEFVAWLGVIGAIVAVYLNSFK